MSLIGLLIGLAFTGLIVGALGRLALPGPDPMSIGMTILVGIAGSLLGGIITSLIAGRNAWSFLVAVLCTTGLVYLIRRSRTGPGQTGVRPRRFF